MITYVALIYHIKMTIKMIDLNGMKYKVRVTDQWGLVRDNNPRKLVNDWSSKWVATEDSMRNIPRNFFFSLAILSQNLTLARFSFLHNAHTTLDVELMQMSLQTAADSQLNIYILYTTIATIR